MECRLVLNNRTDDEITNNDMSGRFHQQLKYYKYRRVPSKNGKAIFYLFFRKEEETYAALRVAKSIKEISLVRYYPSNPINSESSFRPFPPQQIIDICRYTFRSRLVNFENVMNTSISITLPMIATTTTTIQFSVGHEQNNGCNFPCVHCDQHNLLLTNDMKKEKIKIKKDVSDVKDEVIDITDEVIDITDEVMAVKNKVIDITDEFGFDFEMDKNILHKDPNLYTTFFSPISNATSQGEENNKSSDSEDQDESCDVVLTKCLTDISEIVQYLKEGITDY
ncbi:unnamed protein product [Rotaria socialis]|uniref:Uncharacterized protein n=2 Tax=Rotaria socialis TaxID=392032 RepID=A0A817QR19_9BILA|nr:unnamed protein product [Rotaria socialis]CAF3495882.1 unnamed protein product [Rotaria socialis]CAF4540961.1 unnamed protein product [Rotaria socialis]